MGEGYSPSRMSLPADSCTSGSAMIFMLYSTSSSAWGQTAQRQPNFHTVISSETEVAAEDMFSDTFPKGTIRLLITPFGLQQFSWHL